MVRTSFSVAAAALLLLCFALHTASAFPYRQKRIASDQRLAELQTYIALSKLGGKMVTYPVGHGKINPNEIGRKRRSDDRLLRLQELLDASESTDAEMSNSSADEEMEAPQWWLRPQQNMQV